jgi:hypothetical protein
MYIEVHICADKNSMNEDEIMKKEEVRESETFSSVLCVLLSLDIKIK